MQKISIFFLVLSVAIQLSCQNDKKTNTNSSEISSYNFQDPNLNLPVESASTHYDENTIDSEEINQEQKVSEYIDNTLGTGSTPYATYFGKNSTCSEYGCSQIKVSTSNSDVLVSIKRGKEVFQHAYVRRGDNFTFYLPNGIYQTFFYYGKGWSPEKELKNGQILGGFVANEDFGKDVPQELHNNILEYELILQNDGNFSTRPSTAEEAL